MKNIMDAKSVDQIQELTKVIKGYIGKDIVIMSDDRLQTFDKVDVSVTDESIVLESECEDSIIEFTFNEIGELYVDIINIFEDKDLKEIHTVFKYKGRQYSILNLV